MLIGKISQLRTRRNDWRRSMAPSFLRRKVFNNRISLALVSGAFVVISGALPFTAGLGSVAYGAGTECPSSDAWKTVTDQSSNLLGLNSDDYGYNPSGGQGYQCADNSDGGADFKVRLVGTDASLPGNGVEAYPDLIRGCSWTTCYGPEFPQQVGSIPQHWFATSTFSGPTDVSKWDAGYDLWFNRTNLTGPSRGAELFVNLNRGNLSEPTTNVVARNVSLAGANYDVIAYPKTQVINNTSYKWNYVEFWRLSPSNGTTHASLNNFMTWAIQHNDSSGNPWVSNSWYWMGVDSGFEIWYGGDGMNWSYDFFSNT